MSIFGILVSRWFRFLLLGSSFLHISFSLEAKMFDPPKSMIVKWDVVDVRAQRKSPTKRRGADPLQETQLLKGDPVLVYEKRGRWARVECVEQPEYTHNNRWQGYPGWVRWAALTKDKTLYHHIPPLPLSYPAVRERVLEEAKRHLGHPYLWGGRSLHNPKLKKIRTGVDCSGLINWSFRQIGWVVPRDAHEQFMKARPVRRTDLKPGDLVFVAEAAQPTKITHVAFYLGGGKILEAHETGSFVREVSFEEKFGTPLLNLDNGSQVGDCVIYFGTFFTREES